MKKKNKTILSELLIIFFVISIIGVVMVVVLEYNS